MRKLQIFLLVLIIIGLGALATQKVWVPKLVAMIMADEKSPEVAPVRVPPQISYINATSDLIEVELPFPGAVTGKEFGVIGKARGYWFFEASFPMELLDKDGKVIANGYSQAQGEWMTEEFVPFKGELKAPESYIGPATLVLKKNNASGLPEHDASISFPITVEY